MLKGHSLEPWYLSLDSECAILAALWSKFHIDIYQANWKTLIARAFIITAPHYYGYTPLEARLCFFDHIGFHCVSNSITIIYVRIFPIYHGWSWFLQEANWRDYIEHENLIWIAHQFLLYFIEGWLYIQDSQSFCGFCNPLVRLNITFLPVTIY